MAHIIINTPSVYSAKLPTKGWINLAQIRQIETNEACSIVVITWSNGDKQVLKEHDALALIEAWSETTPRNENNHRILNRRFKCN